MKAISLIKLTKKQKIRFGCRIDEVEPSFNTISKLRKYDILIVDTELTKIDILCQLLMDDEQHLLFTLIYVASEILDICIYTKDHEEIE